MKIELRKINFKALMTGRAGSTRPEHFQACIPWTMNSSLSCHGLSHHQQTYEHVHGAQNLPGPLADVVEDGSRRHSCKMLTLKTVGSSTLHEAVKMNWSLYFSWLKFSQACEHFGDHQVLVSYKTFFGNSCTRKPEALQDYEVMRKMTVMAQAQGLGLVDCLVGLDVEKYWVGNPCS